MTNSRFPFTADIFAILPLTDAKVWQFLNAYVDREVLDNRVPVRALRKLSNPGSGRPWTEPRYAGLSEAVKDGLASNDYQSFQLPSGVSDYRRVILAFCDDGYVIFGLAFDAETPDKQLVSHLDSLMVEVGGVCGAVLDETAAPLNMADFLNARGSRLCRHFICRSHPPESSGI
ncbi:MAG TPA: hypothetical protein VGK19_19555 [Capsulimonadaceae bacterium]|jgi:hypothetical protein